MNNLNHIAIIMDGNNRWAKNQNSKSSITGHKEGLKQAKTIIEYCAKIQLKYLSLFVFSTENWNRPKSEINLLMKLLDNSVQKELPLLLKNNIQLHLIGDLNPLPQKTKSTLQAIVQKSKACTGLHLVLAINYGGRLDITQACKAYIKEQISELIESENPISPEKLKTVADHLDEEKLNHFMYSSVAPDPDLIIRTSGETRLSNFYLWSSAYSEIMWTNKLWPDFQPEDLQNCINDFQNKKRRFGSRTLTSNKE
ncbi:MAG: di-trans,poly-cis-decaprenylcistransferase [Bdellovibrionaceae bacterium]|nr:di-trans,poly-cis-decaprenylcistransferase [Pseudobdellovibrionaceae bacterium]